MGRSLVLEIWNRRTNKKSHVVTNWSNISEISIFLRRFLVKTVVVWPLCHPDSAIYCQFLNIKYGDIYPCSTTLLLDPALLNHNITASG
jgi:hypothetical protein